MKLELVYDYKENEILRKSFNELSQNTFGINFEEWYRKKLWNNKYECYSIKSGNKIISNASVNKYQFIINGTKKTALQIGTVMTDEEYKRKGMAKQIINFILEKFEKEYDIIYLFANNSVSEFYPKFGFKKIKQFQIYTTEKIELNTKYKFRKLDMDNLNDVAILKEIGINRIPTSSQFDIINGYEVMFWYCLNVFRGNIYYDNREKIIVIYTTDNEKLNIHDIVLTEKKNYREIIGSITTDEIKEVSFDFNIEADNIEIKEREVDEDDNILFIKGKFGEKLKVIHPITSHA
ncbi:GNAT family N-acetyltransferase [Haliovirga abyssi]|uniref:GNAT family acetyltransferase n=1 Tax=Haliovirga abyssi TaxID=2996794 RepID=A0AAU9D762_9FUSO|nr:GNAT family N-acetyltransferase [Haliovirga abyssi]BDU50403.1 GNAT family acetyltransferase [Haliovirga abyssi]